MSECPIDLIEAAATDQLSEEQAQSLQSHLSGCELCCSRITEAAGSAGWWNDAHRYLDVSMLDDPAGDSADSSIAPARLFEGDDPVADLRSAGVLETPPHPEMLGTLGRYSIEREIGSGGMGVVFKGFDAELNRTVAIKVLAPHLARSGAARQRFVREGRAAAAVLHENVVAIHEVDTSGRLPTLVMQFVDGVSLQRRVDTVGPLPTCDVLRIAAQTAAGLAAAHRQGIVHRDVKPANVLVSAGGQRVWITDFGLARAVDDASLTRTGFIAGTPHYMSPEQARGGAVGPPSDLFSLGGLIYFMLTARPPWRAERSLAVLHRIVQEPHRPVWQLNPDVPREVSDLVDRLLSKEPTARGPSSEETQRRLEAILSDVQNPERPHQLREASETQPATRRSVWALPMVLVPVTCLLTMAVVLSLQAFLEGRRPQASTNATASLPRSEQPFVKDDERKRREPAPLGQPVAAPQVDRVPIGKYSSPERNVRDQQPSPAPRQTTSPRFPPLEAPVIRPPLNRGIPMPPPNEAGVTRLIPAELPPRNPRIESTVPARPGPTVVGGTLEASEPKIADVGEAAVNSTIANETWASLLALERLLVETEHQLRANRADAITSP